MNSAIIYKMRVKSLSLLSLILILASFKCHATEFHVVTEPWESYSTEDGVGYYHDILNAVYKSSGDSLKFTYVPYARSLKMLEHDQVDIALGVTATDTPEGAVTLDFPVELDSAVIVFLKGSFPDWKGLSSLDGRNVIAKIEYNFGPLFGPTVKYSESATLNGMMQMLVKKRVDAVVDYEADILAAIEEEKITQPLEFKNGFNPVPIFFGFSKTENAKIARKKFEEEIKKLIDSGALKAMYVKNFGASDNFPYKKQ